jgi:hypothetical protein
MLSGYEFLLARRPVIDQQGLEFAPQRGAG